jgi:hypothetical protein
MLVYLKNDHAEPSAQRSKALVLLEAFHTNTEKPMLLIKLWVDASARSVFQINHSKTNGF